MKHTLEEDPWQAWVNNPYIEGHENTEHQHCNCWWNSPSNLPCCWCGDDPWKS